MNTRIELEYKQLVSKEQFEALLTAYPNLVFHTHINTYYDTVHHDIETMHGAMRIREMDGKFIFTLKWWENSDLIEHEIDVDTNDIAVFQSREIMNVLDHYHIEHNIIKICTLTTHRAMYITDDYELCFDHSNYNGLEDYEIEYEYKKEHDGLRNFRTILKPIAITYTKNCPSKIQRAIATKR